jgi:hypothetical protein
VRARAGQRFIGGVAEDDRLLALGSQALDVRRRVFDIEVRADGRLLLHEAQVPVRNVVPVEPLDRLAHRDLVEVFDEQPVRDDADAHAFDREPT